MKKILMLFFCVALLTSLTATPGPVSTAQTTTTARGTATVEELANVIFAAIQSNNFDQLPLYVPTDSELNTLKKRSSEDMQALLAELTSETITASLQESFNTVVREGIGKTLNLNELTLSDVRTGKPDAKNKMLLPVTATLTTRANQSMPLRFETLKINGRYFLFQRLEWQAAN